MSRTESFAELAARLQREREAEKPKNYALEGPPRRPPLPAPLRLPSGDQRRRQSSFRGHNIPDTTPLPLDTGIISLRPGAYQHHVTIWWWDPIRCIWIGLCRVCHERFKADPATAARLEQDAASHADHHPLSPVS